VEKQENQACGITLQPPLYLTINIQHILKHMGANGNDNFSSVLEYTCKWCHSSLYSFRVRDLCPKCNHSLNNIEDETSSSGNDFHIHEPPFSISKPFSIVVQPSGRQPFSKYTSSSILHVGVSTSQGNVFHFDERGFHYDDFWKECVSVPLFPTPSTTTQISGETWDSELQSYHEIQKAQHMLPSHGYQALENNCYSYVIGFLNHIRLESSSNHNKYSIVSRFIEPVVQHLESYLRIHDEVYQKGYLATLHVSLPAGTLNYGSFRPKYTCNNCTQPIEGYHYRCQNCADFDLCEMCMTLEPEIDGHLASHVLALQQDQLVNFYSSGEEKVSELL